MIGADSGRSSDRLARLAKRASAPRFCYRVKTRTIALAVNPHDIVMMPNLQGRTMD
jgi:hypothetical protein